MEQGTLRVINGFVVVKFNESFHEPILGNDKYEFKSVRILEVGIQISLTNDFIK